LFAQKNVFPRFGMIWHAEQSASSLNEDVACVKLSSLSGLFCVFSMKQGARLEAPETQEKSKSLEKDPFFVKSL
jgi:hypothetical protein